MPQMMPMNWELIFISVFLFMIMISFKTFFYVTSKENFLYYTKKHNKKMTMNWMW